MQVKCNYDCDWALISLPIRFEDFDIVPWRCNPFRLPNGPKLAIVSPRNDQVFARVDTQQSILSSMAGAEAVDYDKNVMIASSWNKKDLFLSMPRR